MAGGSYSYCQMYGHRCFKCHGSGKTYTKRGDAAIAFMRELRTVAIEQVQPGWLIWEDAGPLGGKAGWKEVLSVGADGCSSVIDGQTVQSIAVQTKGLGHGFWPGNKLQAVASRDELVRTRQLAMEYQERLTKQGKERKRLAA